MIPRRIVSSGRVMVHMLRAVIVRRTFCVDVHHWN
jgi:hypothetical protein